jgi:hypothetical protein
MFIFNRITRVLRADNDGEGNDLGIVSEGNDKIFAGADGEDQWALSEEQFAEFEEGIDVDSVVKANLDNESELDDDSGKDDESDDDSDDDDDDDSGKDSDDDDDDDSGKDSDDDDDDDSGKDSDDDDDDDSGKDADDDDDDDDDDSGKDADAAATLAVEEFSKLVDNSDALTRDFNATAGAAKFVLADFRKDNADLYKKSREINAKYQEALIDKEVELATELSEQLEDAKEEIADAQATARSKAGTGSKVAQEKLQAALDVAMADAAKLYEGLDTKSPKVNKVLIRVVNTAYQTKLANNVSHVRAFVEAVEEAALTHKLEATGTLAKDAVDKKSASKTKKSIKKRVAAAKKTPSRKAKSNAKGKKVIGSSLQKKSGDDFFKDAFVSELGITSPDF